MKTGHSGDSTTESSNEIALRPFPAKLFVETTTRCNLNCFMCVKQNSGSDVREGDFSPELFTRLEPALPHLEALILNGIGEPLLHPHLESFISTAKKLMPASGWIGFQSNGLLMTNLRALALVDAGLDRICLSVDAVTPEMFSRVRQGGELEAIHNAFISLHAAKRSCHREDLQIGVEFVAMRSNLHELPSAIEWAARLGANFAIVTHLLPYDREHTAEALFGTCSDRSVALFKKWKQKALREHLDLSSYFIDRFSRYARNPLQQRVVDLVDEMKAVAEQQGIFLDLKKLLTLDLEQQEEIEKTFTEVKKIASINGLDLRLPSVSLNEQRKCTFVEDRSAFVSWQGDISPCHFLWHRFQCYASGWQQQINPKVFGNLRCNGILDIWNSPEFTAFRKNVLAYDYPSCASCGLAPCDYVNSDQFDQDCHIREVPCGSCLWCMGVFRCLD